MNHPLLGILVFIAFITAGIGFLIYVVAHTYDIHEDDE